MTNLKINKALVASLLLSILTILLIAEKPASVAQAQANDDISLIESKATGIDPKKILFQITLDTPSSIEEIELNYVVESPETNVGGTQIIDAQGKSGYQAFSTELSTNDSSRYIPIGVTITYSWIIKGDTSTLLTTEKQTYVFLDGRFDWKKKQTDYEDWDSFAQMQLITAVESKFSIEFDIDDVISITSADDLLNYVKKHV